MRTDTFFLQELKYASPNFQVISQNHSEDKFHPNGPAAATPAVRKVGVLVFIPLYFKPYSQDVFKNSNYVTLAFGLKVFTVARGEATFMEDVDRVLDEITFPRAAAIVGKIWRWRQFEDRKTGA
ncbi:Uncharacterized protein Fot_56687 [Forsythia ovata]|uniref:Uncharacterized protein n=1 Tax=Forsythia ovata TaxID=205694 RepID=A0ABD1NYP2_9LAMI